MMNIWNINGVELTLDLEDADMMERYESAFETMAAEENELKNVTRMSEKIRGYCRIFRNLYDRIFGEGTAEKIFNGVPDNCTKYDEVYCSFLDYVRTQKAAGEQKRSEILAKYTPNRQQRRAK